MIQYDSVGPNPTKTIRDFPTNELIILKAKAYACYKIFRSEGWSKNIARFKAADELGISFNLMNTLRIDVKEYCNSKDHL